MSQYLSEYQVSEGRQDSTTTTDHERAVSLQDDAVYNEENNIQRNLRRRKGKIVSCAKETIVSASRQLRRRVPYAGHLMTPRRLWLNKIPTTCDVVVEFPADAPDEAIHWLLARIRSQPPIGLGLAVQVKTHDSTGRSAFYLSAPTNILFRAAEEARLPKRLRPDLGGALREFTTRESHCFQQLRSDRSSTTLFSSQERQWLVLLILQSLRAGTGDMESLQGRAYVAEGQSIVSAWQESGLLVQIFPLHEPEALANLQNNWVAKVFTPQPLDDICDYFGVKIALYFAWLGHYTCALLVPAIFGLILYLFLWGETQTTQDMGHVVFSLFNVVWASLYLEAWKRYSVELAFRWGTLSTPPELLEPARPLYKGPLIANNLTGCLEPKEVSLWYRRIFRYVISFPIIALCLGLVFAVMFLMLQFQDWWDSKLPDDGISYCLSVIPKVLLAAAITIMDEAYYKLAVWLNNRENYRLQSKYENNLIAKVVLFQFVNSFLSLFYIAFYLRDENKLKEQLAGLLISRQIIGNLRESAIPYFIEQWKLAKLSFNMWGALSPTQTTNTTILDMIKTNGKNSEMDTETETEALDTNKASADDENYLKSSPSSTQSMASRTIISTSKIFQSSKRNIGQAEIESSLYKYDGTFSDHLEMLVQMGYVVLFSAAFPLAGICALVNNILEIRSDAFKLAYVHQRPFAQRVSNLGTWQNALSLLSLLAVIVNCALIGLSGQVSRLWPGLSTTQTIILIVTLEHIMLALRSALTWLLPELPSWLAAEIARAEHYRHQMQCKGISPRATPPTPASMTSTPADQDIIGIHLPNTNNTTNEQSLDSQESEEFLSNPPLKDSMNPTESYPNQLLKYDKSYCSNYDSLPDSPSSETSTILIRPLHEIDPHDFNNLDSNLHQHINLGIGPVSSSISSTALNIRQKMIIPEIPPYRKKSSDFADQVAGSSSISPLYHRHHPLLPSLATPPKHDKQIAPIFSQIANTSSDSSSNQMLITGVNRNTSDITGVLRPAPSMKSLKYRQDNLATATTDLKPMPLATSTAVHQPGVSLPPSAPCSNVEIRNENLPNVAADSSISNSVSSFLHQHFGDHKHSPSITHLHTKNIDSGSSTATSTPGCTTDDEIKAAELAAKKSRLKQKLVKSARSVAIFSLKLKERRQREAEKAESIANEHAKALAKLPLVPSAPGGELSLIPIEQLIQIDDIKPSIKPKPTAKEQPSKKQQQHHQYQQEQLSTSPPTSSNMQYN